MGLTDRIRHRANVWSWRLCYWWLDTESGQYARGWALFFGVLFCIAVFVHMDIDAYHIATDPHHAKHAFIGLIIELTILIVSAVISAALKPKQKKPAAQKDKAPTIQDGQTVQHHFGTVWQDNSFLLAWKDMGHEAIKSKGGKK